MFKIIIFLNVLTIDRYSSADKERDAPINSGIFKVFKLIILLY